MRFKVSHVFSWYCFFLFCLSVLQKHNIEICDAFMMILLHKLCERQRAAIGPKQLQQSAGAGKDDKSKKRKGDKDTEEDEPSEKKAKAAESKATGSGSGKSSSSKKKAAGSGSGKSSPNKKQAVDTVSMSVFQTCYGLACCFLHEVACALILAMASCSFAWYLCTCSARTTSRKTTRRKVS